MNKSECAFFSASPISSHSKATGNIFLVIDECIFRSGFQNLKETSKECKYHALCSPIPPKVSFLAAFFSVKTVFFASTSPLGDNCMLGSCLFNERYVFSSIFFFFLEPSQVWEISYLVVTPYALPYANLTGSCIVGKFVSPGYHSRRVVRTVKTISTQRSVPYPRNEAHRLFVRSYGSEMIWGWSVRISSQGWLLKASNML